MLARSKPQLPNGIPPAVSLAQIKVPVINSLSIFSHSPRYLESLFGTKLGQILRDLNQFTAFVSYYRSHQTEFSPEKSTIFEHWNAALESRLLFYSPPEHVTNKCDNHFKEAIKLTAVLWITTGLWTFPLSTSLISSMAGHLGDVLAQSDLSAWMKRFPDILLWILVIGGCCTPDEGPRRSFIVWNLQLIAGVRKFERKEDLVRAMRSFIYMDGAYDASLAILWEDIAEEGLGKPYSILEILQ